MKSMLKNLVRDERGTETVEWAIVIGIIAVGAIAAAVIIGAFVQRSFSGLATAVEGQ